MLLLDDNEVCVLVGWAEGKHHAKVIYPELSEAVVEVPVVELLASYSGTAILVRPRFRFDARAGRVRIGDFFTLHRNIRTRPLRLV